MGMGSMGMGSMGMGSMGMGSMGMGSMGGQYGMSSGIGGQQGLGGSFVGVSNAQLTGRGLVGMNQATGRVPVQTKGSAALERIQCAGWDKRGFGGGMYGGGMYGGGMPDAGFAGRQSQSNAPAIRTQWNTDFTSTPPSAQKLSSSMTQRLARLPAIHWSTPGQVVIHGRTAVLRGVVATAHDRDLAEQVVRLEPGIEQVQNLLVVAANSTKPAKQPEAAPGS